MRVTVLHGSNTTQSLPVNLCEKLQCGLYCSLKYSEYLGLQYCIKASPSVLPCGLLLRNEQYSFGVTDCVVFSTVYSPAVIISAIILILLLTGIIITVTVVCCKRKKKAAKGEKKGVV